MTYDDLYNGKGDGGPWDAFMENMRERGAADGGPDPDTKVWPARLPAPEVALKDVLGGWNVEPAVEGDYSPEVQAHAILAYAHGYAAALEQLPF